MRTRFKIAPYVIFLLFLAGCSSVSTIRCVTAGNEYISEKSPAVKVVVARDLIRSPDHPVSKKFNAEFFFNKGQSKSVFIKLFDHSTFGDPNDIFLGGRLYEKGIKTIGNMRFKYGTEIYKGKRDYSFKRIYTHSPNPATTLVVMYSKNLYKGTNVDWSADFKSYSEWQKEVIENYLSDAEDSFTILELSNYDVSMCPNPSK